MTFTPVHGAGRTGQRTPAYGVWLSMRARVLNPRHAKYGDYGGRGIRICRRWLHGEGDLGGFQCFVMDLGERPGGRTLDRIDCDGDYEPGNCRWATRSEQERNKRKPVRHCSCGFFVGHKVPCQGWRPAEPDRSAAIAAALAGW